MQGRQGRRSLPRTQGRAPPRLHLADEDLDRVMHGRELQVALRSEVSEAATLAHPRGLCEPADRDVVSDPAALRDYGRQAMPIVTAAPAMCGHPHRQRGSRRDVAAQSRLVCSRVAGPRLLRGVLVVGRVRGGERDSRSSGSQQASSRSGYGGGALKDRSSARWMAFEAPRSQRGAAVVGSRLSALTIAHIFDTLSTGV